MAVVVSGRRELKPMSGVLYRAFVDPSGGSQDAMTLAVAHIDDGKVILDAVREYRPPFSPASVVSEFAVLLSEYRIKSVTGDRYAGEWPRERFRENGIGYVVAEQSKGELYASLLARINSQRVELLDPSASRYAAVQPSSAGPRGVVETPSTTRQAVTTTWRTPSPAPLRPPQGDGASPRSGQRSSPFQ